MRQILGKQLASVFICILLFLFFSVKAQNSWEKTFAVSSNPRSYVYQTMELPNGNILASGIDDYCFFCPSYNYLFLLNSLGDSIWMKVYTPGQDSYPSRFSIVNDSTIIWAVANIMQDSLGHDMLLYDILKLNLAAGTILQQRHYDIYFSFNFSVRSVDPFLEISGDSTINLILPEKLYKFNLNLDTLYTRRIPVGSNLFDKAKKEINVLNNIGTSSNPAYVYTIFDQNFDSIKSNAIPQNNPLTKTINNWASILNFKAADGTYFGSGYKLNLDSMSFFRMDSLFTVLWIKKIGGNFGSVGGNFSFYDSTYFYAIGFYNHSVNPVTTGRAFIYKLNYNGDSIYFRTYRAFNWVDDDNSFSCGNTTSNGGAIIGGNAAEYGQLFPSSWLVKIDSLGNTPYTINVKEIPLNNSLLSVYPNPASNIITIEQNNPDEFYDFKLFDCKGTLVKSFSSKSNMNIDVSKFTSGLYCLSVFSKAGNQAKVKIIVEH